MLHYPDVLRKAQGQLDEVIGRERAPTFEDEENLPYIQAIVHEVLRWRSPAPLGNVIAIFGVHSAHVLAAIPHMATEVRSSNLHGPSQDSYICSAFRTAGTKDTSYRRASGLVFSHNRAEKLTYRKSRHYRDWKYLV